MNPVLGVAIFIVSVTLAVSSLAAMTEIHSSWAHRGEEYEVHWWVWALAAPLALPAAIILGPLVFLTYAVFNYGRKDA